MLNNFQAASVRINIIVRQEIFDYYICWLFIFPSNSCGFISFRMPCSAMCTVCLMSYFALISFYVCLALVLGLLVAIIIVVRCSDQNSIQRTESSMCTKRLRTNVEPYTIWFWCHNRLEWWWQRQRHKKIYGMTRTRKRIHTSEHLRCSERISEIETR